MRQFTMKLDKKNQGPVVVLKNGLTALLDTGAYIPVWTDDEDILISFLWAEFIRNKVQMSGFGGVTYGNLYKVNIDAGGILYPNMHIIAKNDIDASFFWSFERGKLIAPCFFSNFIHIVLHFCLSFKTCFLSFTSESIFRHFKYRHCRIFKSESAIFL